MNCLKNRRITQFLFLLMSAVFWTSMVAAQVAETTDEGQLAPPKNSERKSESTTGTDSATGTDSESQPGAKPGLNDSFVNPELNVEEFLGRFEVESREVYAARQDIIKACRIRPGMRIADVGAGTGFYSRLFSAAVGDEGWVYSVDISPRFLEHITRQMQEDRVSNFTAIFCRTNSIDVPPNSIDLAFICDTYHHFEYPRETVSSIHRALKKNGVLVLIDFERIPGESREWILGHVRAGKETFREEIESVGFGLEQEVSLPQLTENYFLRFRKR